MSLTREELVKFLVYNPDTGIFTWACSYHSRVKGEVAGTLTQSGYVIIRLHRKGYKAHRLAFLFMTGKWPENQGDHINRIRHDNRWCNLREATQRENNKNSSATNYYPGVTYHKPTGKYQARIGSGKQSKYLGLFTTVANAIKARKLAEE